MGLADQLVERVGERLNPILVKESRQSLKSKQFVVTFSLLLYLHSGPGPYWGSLCCHPAYDMRQVVVSCCLAISSCSVCPCC